MQRPSDNSRHRTTERALDGNPRGCCDHCGGIPTPDLRKIVFQRSPASPAATGKIQCRKFEKKRCSARSLPPACRALPFASKPWRREQRAAGRSVRIRAVSSRPLPCSCHPVAFPPLPTHPHGTSPLLQDPGRCPIATESPPHREPTGEFGASLTGQPLLAHIASAADSRFRLGFESKVSTKWVRHRLARTEAPVPTTILGSPRRDRPQTGLG